MCEGLPTVPPVDRDGSEKQREAWTHLGFPSASWVRFTGFSTVSDGRGAYVQRPAPELRRRVQTTIPRLLHSLLSEIQEW
jgi:hypothetical protein